MRGYRVFYIKEHTLWFMENTADNDTNSVLHRNRNRSPLRSMEAGKDPQLCSMKQDTCIVLLQNHRRGSNCVPREQERSCSIETGDQHSLFQGNRREDRLFRGKGDEHSVFHENRKGAKCVSEKQEKHTEYLGTGEEQNVINGNSSGEELKYPWNRREAHCDPCKQKVSSLCSMYTGEELTVYHVNKR
jgi:hypothetical protein